MKRVGILGGTFDPIHTGHLILAETARDRLSLDEFWLMPTGHSYFKDHREEKVTEPLLRLAMTREGAAENPYFVVTDIEVKRPGNSYTAQTLVELSEEYPETEFYYVVGADTLCMMRIWYEPQVIFDHCVVVAALREDQTPTDTLKAEIEALRAEFGARIELLPVRNIEISSTEIRQLVREGRSIRYLVPEKVETFIREHHLYQEIVSSRL